MTGVVGGLALGAFKVAESTFYTALKPQTEQLGDSQQPNWAGMLHQEIEEIKGDSITRLSLCKIISHEWPFSWIKGQTAFLDVVKREISPELAQEILFKATEAEPQQPSIYVALDPGLVQLNSKRKAKKGKLSFRTILGLHEAEAEKLEKAIPYENKATDVLAVEVKIDESLIGTALIPLCDVIEEEEQKWLIKGQNSENANLGVLQLSEAAFHNEGRASAKDVAQQRIVDHMMQLVDELFEVDLAHEPERKLAPLTYGLVINEKKADMTAADQQTKTQVSLKTEPHFGKPTIHYEAFMEDDKPIFVPFQDLTTQKLELKVFKRKGSSAKKTLDFDRFKKPSIGEDLYNLVNRFGEKQIKDASDDMLTTIDLSEIPFKEGLLINWRDQLEWSIHVVAKSEAANFHLLKQFTFLRIYKRDVNVEPLASYLRPFFSQYEWLVAELNSRIKLFALNGHSGPDHEKEILRSMKMLQPEDLSKLDDICLRFLKSHCCKVISTFNVRELIDRSKGQAFSALDEEIKRCHLTIEALNCLYHEDESLKHEELGKCIVTVTKKILKATQISDLTSKVDEHGLLALQTIQKRFASFALTTWCPLLSDAILETIAAEVEKWRQNEAHAMTLFNLYKKARTIACYSDHKHEEIFSTFEPYLGNWAKFAAMKAKDYVTTALSLKKKEHDESAKKGQKLMKWQMSHEDVENWKQDALTIHGIFQSCHQTWTDLDWPDEEQSLQFGTELFDHVNQVFKYYIEGIYSIVMLDEEFDHMELVLALNSLYNSNGYQKAFRATLLALMEKLAMKDEASTTCSQVIFGLFAQAEEDLEVEAQKMIDLFCQGQRSKFLEFIKKGQFTRHVHNNEPIYDHVDNYFDEESDEETDNLLGYLNALLKFFHFNLMIEHEKITQKHKKNIKDQLFDILEEEMVVHMDKKLNSTILPQFYEALEQAIIFRRNVSLKESSRLAKAKDQVWIKKAKSHELISKLVRNLELSGNPTGQLKLSVARQDHRLAIALRSVSKLEPRLKKTSPDFSLTMSILPNSGESQKTKVYKEATDHIFDMNPDQDKYMFELHLEPDHESFLQIVFYDHSVTRTNKIFRGAFIIPLENIPILAPDQDINANDYIVSGQFYPYPKIHPGCEKLWPIWAEVKNRAAKRNSMCAKFFFNVSSYMNETRRPDIRN